ncbi:hypothetical protein AVEN_206869-1 [Araneus ventricosus]|uniref:Zinc finger BED domain-containing protein 5 n=1 Tax=Araneus ventricosus TaxID=182803 RepID=A0A4Y2HZB8_ARAVE|nr:hypothetical protein AVEN_206869-1 [Araneus ventricosus]
MMMIGSSVDYVRSGGMRNVPVTKAVENLYATTAKFSKRVRNLDLKSCVLLPATSEYTYCALTVESSAKQRARHRMVSIAMLSVVVRKPRLGILETEFPFEESVVPLFLYCTVSRRIKDMSIDIEATINEGIKKSPFFSIQVDESTDVSDLSILLVIARYLNVNELEENLLLCYPLTKTH